MTAPPAAMPCASSPLPAAAPPSSRLPAAAGKAPIGLVLTGGGARAAYQVGVLVGIRRALLDAGWPVTRSPFQVYCGTSAGAINSTVVA
jgi:predicted acylesterase/phospholipase RssA